MAPLEAGRRMKAIARPAAAGSSTAGLPSAQSSASSIRSSAASPLVLPRSRSQVDRWSHFRFGRWRRLLVARALPVEQARRPWRGTVARPGRAELSAATRRRCRPSPRAQLMGCVAAPPGRSASRLGPRRPAHSLVPMASPARLTAAGVYVGTSGGCLLAATHPTGSKRISVGIGLLLGARSRSPVQVPALALKQARVLRVRSTSGFRAGGRWPPRRDASSRDGGVPAPVSVGAGPGAGHRRACGAI
jgi:hypothetical protein